MSLCLRKFIQPSDFGLAYFPDPLFLPLTFSFLSDEGEINLDRRLDTRPKLIALKAAYLPSAGHGLLEDEAPQSEECFSLFRVP